MIEETAKVVSVIDDKVVVEAAVKSTCSSCNAQDNCGSGTIARAFSSKVQRLTLSSPVPVKVGDTVSIGIHEQSVLIASWLLYLLPILVFFIALLSLSSFWSNTLHELTLFALACVPTFFCFRYVAGKCKQLDKGRFQPVIIRRWVS